MTPHKQLLGHDPANGIWGDCYRTVFACLLDMHPSEVPHFYDGAPPPDEAEASLARFLAGRGLTKIDIVYPGETDLTEILRAVGSMNPGIYYILGGHSAVANHVVICCDDEIVHDPSMVDSGIVGPGTDGLYWITFLAPLLIKR